MQARNNRTHALAGRCLRGPDAGDVIDRSVSQSNTASEKFHAMTYQFAFSTRRQGSSRRLLTRTILVACRRAATTIGVCAGVWGIRHARSPAVRRWRAGSGGHHRASLLQVRTFGSGRPVVLLLHGMAGAGNTFGAVFDQLGASARVVVPDLLGFGGSMLPPGAVSGEDHLDALDGMLEALGLGEAPLVVVGHSMGGPLALRFAARHSDQVRTVVTLCAALYRDSAEADSRIAKMGPFEAALSGDGRLPNVLCAWMCRHRLTAGWVAVAMRPDLPVAVARSAVEHTWDSYLGALDGLLHASDWKPALDRLAAAGVPVVLVEGSVDPVPVPGRAAALADVTRTVRYVERTHATHMLPLTEGDWCANLVAEQLEGTPLRSDPDGLREQGWVPDDFRG